MHIPVIRGVIDRRILVNYRVDPETLAKVLPMPFRPKLVHGCGVAGICLIRLTQVRPRILPRILGVTSENSAHRITVEWEQDDQIRQGVYIPRRDTSSRINSLAGGRMFPGVHHHARFTVQEDNGCFSVSLTSDDGDTHVSVEGRVTSDLPPTSVFRSIVEASAFFEKGAIGYSATTKGGEFDGMELCTDTWNVQPLAIDHVESSYFGDERLFPAGSIELDSALLMQGIEHEWHGREPLCVCDAKNPRSVESMTCH